METEPAVDLWQFNRQIWGITGDRQTPDIHQAATLYNRLSTPGGIITEAWPYLFATAGLILFGMLVWGALEIQFGAATPKSAESGKQRITNAVIGFVLLFSVFWMGQLIQQIFGINFSVGQEVNISETDYGSSDGSGGGGSPNVPANPGNDLSDEPIQPVPVERDFTLQQNGRIIKGCLISSPDECWSFDTSILEQSLQQDYWTAALSSLSLPSISLPTFSIIDVDANEVIGADAESKMAEAQTTLETAYQQLWALNTRIEQREEQEQLENAQQLADLLSTAIQSVQQAGTTLGQGTKTTIAQMQQAQTQTLAANNAVIALAQSAQQQGSSITAQQYIEQITASTLLVETSSANLNFAASIPVELLVSPTILVNIPAGDSQQESQTREQAIQTLQTATTPLPDSFPNPLAGGDSGTTLEIENSTLNAGDLLLTGRIMDEQMAEIFMPVQMEIEFEFAP